MRALMYMVCAFVALCSTGIGAAIEHGQMARSVRPGAPNDNTDEEADMQPAPEKEPEAEVETATHHQVRTIHTPMPPPVQSKARMHAALAMSMYYATCC